MAVIGVERAIPELPFMLTSKTCENCNRRLRRRDLRNLAEFLIAPLILPYSCVRCGRTAFRLRFIVPPSKKKPILA